MRKFKGISRVIKGSTTHFQGYLWKTFVTLLYVNKISSNFSHLFQEYFRSMQHSKEVSIIFLKKKVDDRTVWNLERKINLCWSIFCVFHKFQRDSRFLHKIPGYFQGSRSQNILQAFQGFQGAVGTVGHIKIFVRGCHASYNYMYNPS